MASFALPMCLANDGLSDYLQSIKKFPVLSVEEEFMLINRYREYEDLDAAHKLVTSHLRLAAKVAVAYRNYGLPLADLISEANIGLMTAIKKFEPEKGFRLSTYAIWWIKAALNDFVLRSWSLVRMGTVAAQKKLFYNLNRLKARLGLYKKSDLDDNSVGKISKILGVEEKDVREMNARMNGDVSLNLPCSDEEGAGEKQDFIVDKTPNQEVIIAEEEEVSFRKKLFMQAMTVLNDREREIIVARRLLEEPKTLEELSEKYNISRERVRQIEQRAFEKVCNFVRSAV